MSEKIWLQHYPSGIPAEVNINNFDSLVDLFEHSCKKFHNCVAVRNLGCTLTYSELESKSRAFAAYLQQKLGLKKGERLAIMLPNVMQYFVALFGALRAGLTVVNVNPLYKPLEIAHQLADSGAESIIILANFAHNLQQALSKTAIKQVIITELGDLFGFPKAQMVNFVIKKIKKLVPDYELPEAISFKKMLKEGGKLGYQRVEVNSSDLAFLQYTGGTTGISKGAMLTHGNMVANIEQSLAWVGSDLIPGKEAVVTPLPLYHIFSLTICALGFLKMGGECILITNPRDIPNFIKELQKTHYTVFVGINTLFNALIHHPDFAKLKFKSLKLTISGGMPTQKVVADRWQQITGNVILEGYGLTETSPVVTINPTTIKGFTGSIGMPIPSTDVSIRDENNNELSLGVAGELCVKGPQVMSGYWNQPEETKKIFTTDGWLRTGDIARMDEQGLIYIVDRKKDMILVSGFNVYPNEIEDIIATHPGVREVAVIGVPCEATGEVPKAFVIKNDPNLNEQDIIDYCRKYLTGYKIPKYIEFRTELPKSNVGKILRRMLREEKPATAQV